jgi:hypothetical protein
MAELTLEQKKNIIKKSGTFFFWLNLTIFLVVVAVVLVKLFWKG